MWRLSRAVGLAAGSLGRHGARAIHFPICSTFDSTGRGNIGPRCSTKWVSPSQLRVRRTRFRARPSIRAPLRGRRLLSESSMRNHPLTPMRDADLVRQYPVPVGLVPLDVEPDAKSSSPPEQFGLAHR
jgi:uncharacterized protein YgbK (DUF1537 family)